MYISNKISMPSALQYLWVRTLLGSIIGNMHEHLGLWTHSIEKCFYIKAYFNTGTCVRNFPSGVPHGGCCIHSG